MRPRCRKRPLGQSHLLCPARKKHTFKLPRKLAIFALDSKRIKSLRKKPDKYNQRAGACSG
jgi:hypothetical protein